MIEIKKPELLDNIDYNNYVYGLCKCPLPICYAIKWRKIKDGKTHTYECKCENCKETISVIA